MRESGFYKIIMLNKLEWEIAKFYSRGGYWLRCGQSSPYYDTDFKEINEQKIELIN